MRKFILPLQAASMRHAMIAALLILFAASTLAARDLFLKPLSFFVDPGAEARVRVLNGTFTKSENSVARNRLRDLSVLTPDDVEHADTTAWSGAGDTTIFVFRTGSAGTYVVGASTLPRGIKLDAKQFNDYLATDGVPDVLAARRRAGELNKPSHERYSKHVKTLVQVGDVRRGRLDTALGYPAELVPLGNPYLLKTGDTLRLRALVDGRPAANQFVLAAGRTTSGARLAMQSVRSDSGGVARITLTGRG